MSYKSQSALAALLALSVVYGGYFAWAAGAPRPPGEILWGLVGTVVALTVILVVLETALAVRAHLMRQGGHRADERDTLNELRSARNGFFAVMGLVWLTPVAALAGGAPVLIANLALAAMVLGEAVHFGSRVVYDRLSA